MKNFDLSFVTTAFELPGHRIVRNVGVVRGIVVRSRSLVGAIGASLQTLLGGNITLFTALCEKARGDDANDVAAGVTEVLAYGTAVIVE
jgi:uncharacterized protein YbjQ (UPF0145 family)